ncbi:hypothetical protein NCAS_0F04050 [Naumovozyma castellii]|uniref:Uncharacterized protein n=1 Tax=Naumovozyma castellii TaxID=27288 RepID=G0VHB6_NAUCA|nr:hypothetical protein NCAS_0F04050 [Naumovozyma castellii CBS 4309]CCC70889.1 hypothetical protein NCAS_0F04050 [Naumovozyma castellii CBS 4309]
MGYCGENTSRRNLRRGTRTKAIYVIRNFPRRVSVSAVFCQPKGTFLFWWQTIGRTNVPHQTGPQNLFSFPDSAEKCSRIQRGERSSRRKSFSNSPAFRIIRYFVPERKGNSALSETSCPKCQDNSRELFHMSALSTVPKMPLTALSTVNLFETPVLSYLVKS